MDDQDKNQPIGNLANQAGQPMPTPNVSKEDTLLQSAGQGLDEVVQQPTQSMAPTVVPVKRSPKKVLIFLAVILVLGGIAFGVSILLGSKKTEAPAPAATTPTVNQKVQNSLTLDKVVYAFAEKFDGAQKLYSRPALGGDRTDLGDLKDGPIYRGQAVGQVVLYSNDKVVFASTDGGNKFNEVYRVTGSEALTTSRLSSDGKKIAFGTFGSTDKEGSKIYTVKVDGSDKQEVMVSKEGTVQPVGLNNSNGKIAYTTGCWQCDGPRSSYNLYDIATKKTTQVLKVNNNIAYNAAAFSDDLTQFVYNEGVESKDGEMGHLSTAPYKIKLIDTKTMKTTLVETIGKAGEKNGNGTTKFRTIHLGFLNNSAVPYFAENNIVSIFKSGKVQELFKSELPIRKLEFVSDKNIIYGAEADSNLENGGDYLLNNYDLTTKKSTQIFQGTDNTYIIGITTK